MPANITSRRLCQAREDPEQRRFPASGGAQQCHDGPGIDVEVQRGNDLDTLPVRLNECLLHSARLDDRLFRDRFRSNHISRGGSRRGRFRLRLFFCGLLNFRRLTVFGDFEFPEFLSQPQPRFFGQFVEETHALIRRHLVQNLAHLVCRTAVEQNVLMEIGKVSQHARRKASRQQAEYCLLLFVGEVFHPIGDRGRRDALESGNQLGPALACEQVPELLRVKETHWSFSKGLGLSALIKCQQLFARDLKLNTKAACDRCVYRTEARWPFLLAFSLLLSWPVFPLHRLFSRRPVRACARSTCPRRLLILWPIGRA